MAPQNTQKLTPDAILEFRRAEEARSNARFAARTKLPGWKIYFRAEMRRAARKRRSFYAMMRAVQ